MENVKKAVEFIQSKTDVKPEIALILGSGLGAIADEIDGIKISYEDIPGFPPSKVEGHAGKLVIGELQGKKVVAMQGRFHYYEGYPMSTVVFPVRVMKFLGAEKMVVTNAAGGVNKSYIPGDLMIIEDHINAMCNNPLMGPNNPKFGPRFPDMSYAYNPELIKVVENIAEKVNLRMQKGVYYGSSGPTYETPAEIRMIRTLGADAVGMSTVPEVITANHMSMKVLGVSCITNMASGILPQPLSHEEVIETTEKIKKDFINLMKQVISQI